MGDRRRMLRLTGPVAAPMTPPASSRVPAVRGDAGGSSPDEVTGPGSTPPTVTNNEESNAGITVTYPDPTTAPTKWTRPDTGDRTTSPARAPNPSVRRPEQ